MWSRRAKPLVGVDIGSHAVKLVRLSLAGRRFQLLNLGVIPLPTDAVIDGTIAEASAIQESLRRLVTMEELSTRDVALGLSGHSVIVKKVRMARMTEDELASSMSYEAEQYIPFDVYDVNIDFQILQSGEARNERDPQMDVLLVAAKKGRVEELNRVAQAVQLRPIVVDVDMLALMNCFEFNYPDELRGRVISLVHVGASLMTVLILKDGLSAFQRDIALGGNQYTAALQKALGISREDAEGRKLGVAGDPHVSTDVLGVLRATTEDVVTEIRRSFEFYLGSAGDEPIEQVYLSGGCARMKGLGQLLSKSLRLPVELLDPFRQIDVPEKRFDPDFVRDLAPMAAVAVGLAMRRKDDR
jgi:type IV pilus assembly protein PilM